MEKITPGGSGRYDKRYGLNMFKSTGSVDTFLEMKQIENIQNNLANLQKVETNGNSKNEGNNNSGK